MKSSILILLSLIVPSLCFGESINFEWSMSQNDKFKLVEVTHSALRDENGKRRAQQKKFFLGDLSTIENNDVDQKAFMEWLKFYFPIGFEALSEKSKINEWQLPRFVDKLLIFNDYTLTEKLEIEDGISLYYHK